MMHVSKCLPFGLSAAGMAFLQTLRARSALKQSPERGRYSLGFFIFVSLPWILSQR